MRRLRLFVTSFAALVLIVPLAADAAEDDRYTATISPEAVLASSSASYTIEIKNHPKSPHAASEAHIKIPDGFSVDTLPAATTTCSALPWAVVVDAVNSKIDLTSPPGGELCPSGKLFVAFSATSSPTEGLYEWTTTLSGGDGPFTLKEGQPTVSVTGTALTISVTGPPDPSMDRNASFGFSANEPVTGFECSLDSGPFSACSSGVSYGPLADGSHAFRVQASDLAGNSASATYTWTIDATAPDPPTITTGPQNPSGSSSASFSFSDGDSTAALWCQIDGGGFSDCSSGSANYSGLSDGSHAFGVKAVDPIGHESSVTSYTWTIDTVHPIVTLTDKPPLITNRTSASFGFVSNGQGTSTYQCKLDGGVFVSCTSPRAYSDLGDGSHTFAVRAISLGNVGLTTEYTWTVDTVAPDTTITSAPPSSSNSASASFTFTTSEGGSTFACGLDASGITPCDSPKAYAGLGDGSHTFRVQAVDPAGNADPSPASYSWRISGVGPATVDTTPPGNVKRLKRSVSYGVLKLAWARPSDGDFDHVRVFVSTSPKSSPRTPVYKGKGTEYTNKRFKNGLYYRYAIVSYDRAGNASRGTTIVVPPSALLRSPRDTAVVKGPPLLRWARIAKATYYNVQLYYGSPKVLSAWPNVAMLPVKRRWVYAGRSFHLRKGLYHWYVWPGFGPRSNGRYGQLLGQGSFKVR